MILPIRAYGDPVLRKETSSIPENSAALQKLIDDMIETMRHAEGAGLAAPQIGKSLRIFVADLSGALSELPEDERPRIPRQPMVCINPEMVFSSQEKEEFEEGCLSIPKLPITLKRPNRVKLRYQDRNFKPKELEVTGRLASVLQHENDHLDGILHIDYLSPFKKKVAEARLNQIKKGVFEADYPMQIGDG